MTHFIRQQYLHVEVNGSETDALALQNRLSRVCQDWLPPALERVLDRCVPSAEYWSLDCLDIDVGVLTLEHLEQDLSELVAQAVEKKLREQTLNSPTSTLINKDIRHKTSQQSLAEALVHFLNTGRLPWSMRLSKGKNLEQTLLDAWQNSTATIPASLILSTLNSTNAIKRLVRQFSPLFLTTLLDKFSPEGKKIIIAVLPILQTSNAPVAVKQFERQLCETVFSFIASNKTLSKNAIIAEAWHTVNLSNNQQQALDNWLIDTWRETSAIHTHPEIIHHLLISVTARKRLVNQLSPSLMTRLVTQLAPGSETVITAILPLLQNADAPAIAFKQFEQQLWETVFSFIATGKTVTENAIIAEAWQTLAVKTPVLENLLIRHWSAAITRVPSPKLKPLSNVPIIESPDSINDPIIDHEQEDWSIIDSAKPVFKQTDTHKPPDTQKNLPSIKAVYSTADIQEGIYIENAGLILLHPFLPQFFTALGIAEEDQLIQPERALCLLHFLTTGLLIAPEYELTLAKILCNIPLDLPVESDIELTESEIEEAEALLNAVIHHWDALRNTSIDGLRGEFLFRLGKLSLREDGDWLLQVENKTADILLNQLPWGISMIKLPWMPRMLWVEWHY